MEGDMLKAFDTLLSDVVFEPLAPDAVQVIWANGVEYRGEEGAQAFLEDYPEWKRED